MRNAVIGLKKQRCSKPKQGRGFFRVKSVDQASWCAIDPNPCKYPRSRHRRHRLQRQSGINREICVNDGFDGIYLK